MVEESCGCHCERLLISNGLQVEYCIVVAETGYQKVTKNGDKRQALFINRKQVDGVSLPGTKARNAIAPNSS